MSKEAKAVRREARKSGLGILSAAHEVATTALHGAIEDLKQQIVNERAATDGVSTELDLARKEIGELNAKLAEALNLAKLNVQAPPPAAVPATVAPAPAAPQPSPIDPELLALAKVNGWDAAAIAAAIRPTAPAAPISPEAQAALSAVDPEVLAMAKQLGWDAAAISKAVLSRS
jgi:hypothetical protein